VVINAVSSEAATSRQHNKFLNFIPLLRAACWADATTDAVVLVSNPTEKTKPAEAATGMDASPPPIFLLAIAAQ